MSFTRNFGHALNHLAHFNIPLGASDSPLGHTVSPSLTRGLGAGSTLVRVDGRRAMHPANGNRVPTLQGFVDLNTIPSA